MLHIVLTILKIPFILLAVLLLILLTVALLLLFVAVRYQASAEKTDKLTATARVTWLLHFLSVKVSYQAGKPQISVKVCGYTVVGEKKKKKRKRKPAPSEKEAEKATAPEAPHEMLQAPEEPEQKQPPEAESVQPPARPLSEDESAGQSFAEESVVPEAAPEKESGSSSKQEEISASPESFRMPDGEPAPKRKVRETPDTKSVRRQAKSGIFDRLRSFFENIKNSFRAFLEKIRNIRESFEKLKRKLEYYKKLWYDVHTQEALRHGKKELRYLFKHYFPRKIEGNVLFGLDDPAATGQLLGVLSILQVASGNHVIVEADFTKPVLEGDISLKGHIRACHLVKTAFLLLLDKHIRITIKRVRKMLNH